jgi:hypothetical protein
VPEVTTQGFRHNAKSYTEITKKGKSCGQTQECVGTTNGLVNIVTEEACLDLGKLFGPGKDTLAYGIGVTLFQGKKNRQRESMNCFSVDLRRTRQGYDNQKEENLITATGLYLQVHSLKGSLHETIIWANYEDLQSHCHPWRTNIRVTRGVTMLENHYNRAGCPLRTKSCDTLVKWSGYDQRKENKAMLDEQNYGEKERLEGRKDQCNMETPHTQSQQRLCNTTTAPTADPLYRADSLLESKQPCGSKQGRETNAEKIWFALKEKN